MDIILDFERKPGILPLQFLFWFALVALFGINFGFNERWLAWLRQLLLSLFDADDPERFALKYFIFLSLSSLVLVNSVFAIFAIVSHRRKIKARR